MAEQPWRGDRQPTCFQLRLEGFHYYHSRFAGPFYQSLENQIMDIGDSNHSAGHIFSVSAAHVIHREQSGNLLDKITRYDIPVKD